MSKQSAASSMWAVSWGLFGVALIGYLTYAEHLFHIEKMAACAMP